MDLADYLRFLLALIFVLGLIGLLAWLARRFRIGGLALPATTRRRLEVLEMTPLDARRKLVLVRRDGVEHLLLLGQDGNRIVETAIAAERTAAPFEFPLRHGAGE